MNANRPIVKPISREGIAAALEKAHRYRLLNDSIEAESICLDVLLVDPENVDALVTHVLAISDQFFSGSAEDLGRADVAAARLKDPYTNAYYRGVISERWAKAVLRRQLPRAGEMAHEWLEKALVWYAKAEGLAKPGNDEAILRWNACVRLMDRDPHIKPRIAEPYEPSFE